ncbi:hypothetical protein C8R47DRAFT_1328469 [Mycena vitilis]|nr:hypothetical protein C8R47DRAFT_1328469 [Mycena vitilis]
MADETTPTVPAFPEPGLCKGSTNHSLHYFFEEGSLYIRLTGSLVVYCLFASILAKRAAFFGDLSVLPAPTAVAVPPGSPDRKKAKAKALEDARKSWEAGNGRTEHSPLELQSTEAQFEAFIECIFMTHGPESLQARPSEFYRMALEVADMFHAPTVIERAVVRLQACKELPPVWCLYLAIEYGVQKWIEPAFRALVRTPLQDLTVTQIREIGFSPYIILAETQAKILQHRALCALTVPPVTHGSSCTNHDKCNNSWSHAWWGESVKHGIAVALIHPAGMPAKKILSSLPNLITSYHMKPDCRKLTIKALADKPSVLLREEAFIAAAIREMKKF